MRFDPAPSYVGPRPIVDKSGVMVAKTRLAQREELVPDRSRCNKSIWGTSRQLANVLLIVDSNSKPRDMTASNDIYTALVATDDLGFFQLFL